MMHTLIVCLAVADVALSVTPARLTATEGLFQSDRDLRIIPGTNYYLKPQYNPSQGLLTYDLGSAMTLTTGSYFPFPTTILDDQSMKWRQATGSAQVLASCTPGLGILYAHEDGISETNPLAAYYTPDGKIAGIRMNVYGKWDKWWGLAREPTVYAAQANLINQGFWLADEVNGGAYMAVSFRAFDETCANRSDTSKPIGDRLVINQMKGGIARRIPMTAEEAKANNFQPGACIPTMGQHWFYDLEKAPKMSWKSENLMPLVPMYHTTGPNTGKLNSFFIATPVSQSQKSKKWDNTFPLPGLPERLMCLNWCDVECRWDNSWWSTEHVFFNANPGSVQCANPVSFCRDPLRSVIKGECPGDLKVS